MIANEAGASCRPEGLGPAPALWQEIGRFGSALQPAPQHSGKDTGWSREEPVSTCPRGPVTPPAGGARRSATRSYAGALLNLRTQMPLRM